MKNSHGDPIFSLDIGTRSVVGIVAREADEGLEILHTAMEEHRNRAMLDGQIHDVVQVAEVVGRIKKRLEKELGQPLKEVAVAAAGRALKTFNGKASRQTPTLQEFTPEDVLALELAAVQNAQEELKGNGGESVKDYHCVGYSVVRYLLEGHVIGNLVGQRGLMAEIEIIGTFLPRVVVDSLFSVLQRVGLEMKSLTLEPIAAINVVIPPNMRQLNLALVDVGAGTSDIAITAGGTVLAYAMVPVAGDEVTEQICQKYLLEFGEGEQSKRALKVLMQDISSNTAKSLPDDKKIVVCDVLGFEQEIHANEILSTLEPTVEHLAHQIADKILTLNGKSPQAVIMVGGGSLTPLLPGKVAEALGLPKGRVGIRGRESLKGLTGNVEGLKGPEFVTPVGIAVTSLKHQTLGFYEVTVNGQPVRLFNVHLGTVGDALLAAGVSLRRIHGLPGLALTAEVNGQVKILRGTLGEPAQISVNGMDAKLDMRVNPGDAILFVEAKQGENGGGVVSDLVPVLTPLDVTVNGNKVHIEPQVTMNGKNVSMNTQLEDGARIRYQVIETVVQLLDITGELTNVNKDNSIRYILNGIEKTVQLSVPEVYLNDERVSLDAPVRSGDRLDIHSSRTTGLKINEIVDLSRWAGEGIRVTVNDMERTFPGQASSLWLNGQPATGDEMINNGDNIAVKAGRSVDLILSELLMHINFDTTPPEGKTRLDIMVNGLEGNYTTPIPNNARVDLIWR